MAASSKLMIGEAERRFPVRIRIGVPPDGLGTRLDRITAWLEENCGADGWAITPSRLPGSVSDAIAVHFGDPALAGAFIARWCRGGRADTVDGAFQVRDADFLLVGRDRADRADRRLAADEMPDRA
jgi:hypothetical protein